MRLNLLMQNTTFVGHTGKLLTGTLANSEDQDEML